MKIAFVCFFWLLLLPWTLLAQDHNSLLWQITGNELSQPSYLFGTVHVQDKRAFQLPDSVMPALLRCEVMAGELDIQEVGNAAGEMSAYLFLPDSIDLEDFYSKEEYKRVKKAAKKNLGLMHLFVNRIKPILTYSLISEASMPKDEKTVLDKFLQEEALEAGLEVIGLETMEEQMAALDQLPLTEQAALLLDYIDNPTDERAYYNNLVATYVSQDLDSLNVLYLDYDGRSSGMDSALVDGRNHTMATRMAKLIQRKSSFVAVGALHLPGESGMIRLLEEKGFEVKPVYSSYTPEGESVKPMVVRSRMGHFEAQFPRGPEYRSNEGNKQPKGYQYSWKGDDYTASFIWRPVMEDLGNHTTMPRGVATKPLSLSGRPALDERYSVDSVAQRVITLSVAKCHYEIRISGAIESAEIEAWIQAFRLLP